MSIQLCGLTHVGRVRQGNEDAILLAPKHALAAVCDGMGGHEAGEVASNTAVDAIHAWFAQPVAGDTFALEPTLPAPVRRLAGAVLYADEAIRREAAVPGRQGMGTTVVAAMVDLRKLYVAHAGDSRAYVARRRTLTQVTHDHSVVNDLLRAGIITAAQAVHVKKNAITRALGVTDNLVVDVDAVDLLPGDVVLLCSDGLHGQLPDDDLLRFIGEGEDLPAACNKLVEAANEAGGVDNISAVLLRVDG